MQLHELKATQSASDPCMLGLMPGQQKQKQAMAEPSSSWGQSKALCPHNPPPHRSFCNPPCSTLLALAYLCELIVGEDYCGVPNDALVDMSANKKHKRKAAMLDASVSLRQWRQCSCASCTNAWSLAITLVVHKLWMLAHTFVFFDVALPLHFYNFTNISNIFNDGHSLCCQALAAKPPKDNL